jgi:hypothetical protein
MTGLMWHVHEMIFGFVAAIVVGFLTATRAWTSRETLRGPALGPCGCSGSPDACSSGRGRPCPRRSSMRCSCP